MIPTHQALASLATVYPLFAALELYVFEFLVRARLLRVALRTTTIPLFSVATNPVAVGAIARLLPARDNTFITSTYFTRLIAW